MATRKKQNNIVSKKGNLYYRVRVFVKKIVTDDGKERIFQNEVTIPFKTKNMNIALRLAKKVEKHIERIKDGTIQKFQFKDYFEWLNDEGTSTIVEMTLDRIIPKYLSFKESKKRARTVERDRISINQLCEFIGYSKPVSELTYLDIEGSKGLIQHLQSKGYRNNGINVTLLYLKVVFTWLYKKEQLIDKAIEFDKLADDDCEYYIDEYQIQAIHNYIDDESNGIDSFFKRCYIFYEFTGVRAIEPFIGEIYGDWLYVDASKSKGHNLRKVHLSEDLKAILMEIQSFRDGYIKMGSKRPNDASYELIAKRLKKIVRALDFNTNRKITLKSFRHHYGIKRVYTTGNIFQVAMEMGHKYVTTTQLYLRFQLDEIKDHFPSLIPIIESMENMQKNVIRGTKSRGTIYSNDNKLYGSHRE